MCFNTFSGVYVVYLCVCAFPQRDVGGNSDCEKRRETLTLSRDMITDTQGYSDLPVVGVCDVTLIILS